MAEVEASVRVRRATATARERALTQMNLRRKIRLLFEQWKAAGGSHVLPDIRYCVRPRPAKAADGQSEPKAKGSA